MHASDSVNKRIFRVRRHHVFQRCAALSALFAGFCLSACSSANGWNAPYTLPIASSGPIVSPPPVAERTQQARQLADQVGPALYTSPAWHIGQIRHIVLVRFKADITQQAKDAFINRFARLIADSRRPDGKRVIQSLEYGAQQAVVGPKEGMQEAFVLTFASEGDRNYFVGKPIISVPGLYDPSNDAFKAYARAFVQSYIDFDYVVRRSYSSK